MINDVHISVVYLEAYYPAVPVAAEQESLGHLLNLFLSQSLISLYCSLKGPYQQTMVLLNSLQNKIIYSAKYVVSHDADVEQNCCWQCSVIGLQKVLHLST